MRTAVYTIALNEEAHVFDWVESAFDAEELVIVDTGSTDGTVKAAQDLGVTVHEIKITPWRFDDARNVALALLPDDVDMCISLDMDERLQPDWKQPLEAAWAQGITRPHYRYVWNWTPEGEPDIVFGRDHIHTRHGYRWKHPAHEILVPSGILERAELVEGIEVHHHADETKPRNYLPLLAMAAQETPEDDRIAYYFARDLQFAGQHAEARWWFKRFLELSHWAPERAAAMRRLGWLAEACLPIEDAEAWFLKACAEAPNYREPWLDLIRWSLEKGRLEMVHALAKRACEITDRQLEYLTESAAWDGWLEQLASSPIESVEPAGD